MFFGGIIGGGGSAAPVQLPDLSSFANFEISGPVYSGIQFNSDGGIYRMSESGTWQYTGKDWLLEGAASAYYLVRTVNGPDSLNEIDGGTLQQMNTTRSYALSTNFERECGIEFSISSDASGTPVVAGPKTYTLSAEKVF